MFLWSMVSARIRRLHSSFRKFITTLLEDEDEDVRNQPTPASSFFGVHRGDQSVSTTGSSLSPAHPSPSINKAIKGRPQSMPETSSSSGSVSSSTIPYHPSLGVIMLDVFDEALSCPVCLEDFDKVPKILPTCGHSFCLPCIEHWYEFSGGSATGILRCPVCKCKTNLRILQGGSRCLKKPSTSLFGGHASDKQRRLPPPPLPSALRKLLCDSPSVMTVLKLRKRLNKCVGSCQSTSTAEGMISGLQTLLTCRSCHFRLEEPRMLPACRHSFCTSCLQKIYKPLTCNASGGDVGTIVCPVCSTLYRFNYHTTSPPATPPVSNTKNICNNDEKHIVTCTKPAPPKEKLATYLPFDYVLGCLLDAVPERL